MPKRPTSVPRLTTDEEAEAFLDLDLSDLDFAEFQSVDWERHLKSARVNMRLPQPLLDAVKASAVLRGIPYQRLIREALEREVGNQSPTDLTQHTKRQAVAAPKDFGQITKGRFLTKPLRIKRTRGKLSKSGEKA